MFDVIVSHLRGLPPEFQSQFTYIAANHPVLSQMGLGVGELAGTIIDNVHLLLQGLISKNPLYIRHLSQSLEKQFPNIYQIEAWKP